MKEQPVSHQNREDLAALDENKALQKQRLSLAVDEGLNNGPDRAARILDLNRKTGLDTAIISRNLDDIEKQCSKQELDLETLARQFPKTAAFMRRGPYQGAAAYDDIAILTAIEKLYGELSKKRRTADDAGPRRLGAAGASDAQDGEAPAELKNAAREIARILGIGDLETGIMEEFWQRLTDEAKAGFQARLDGLGIPGRTISAAVDAIKIKKAQAYHAKLAAIMNMARRSALRNRSPQLFQEYLESLSANGSRAQVALAAEPVTAYMGEQGVDAVALFESLGVDEATLVVARDTDTDVGVPMAVFITRMADSQHLDEILAHVRRAPAAMTMAEATIADSEIEAKLQSGIDALMADLAGATDLARMRTEAATVGRHFRTVARSGAMDGANAAPTAPTGTLLESMFLMEAANRIDEGGEPLTAAAFFDTRDPSAGADETGGQQTVQVDPLTRDTGWRQANIKAANRRGKVIAMNAGQAYDSITRRIEAARQLLECIAAG